jgi:hypothetical protein
MIAWSTSTVARASESARWSGETDAPTCAASVESLWSRTSSRRNTVRARASVSRTAGEGQVTAHSAARARRKPMSKRALWATSAASGPTKSRNIGSTVRIDGAPCTVASVIPVREAMNAGIGRSGVHEGAELAEHLAAAHLDRTDLGYRVGGGVGARRLEVDHDEGGLRERSAEIVEAQLAAGGHGGQATTGPRHPGAGMPGPGVSSRRAARGTGGRLSWWAWAGSRSSR